MRIILAFLLVTTATTGSIAQKFIGEAPLPSIPADGFYRIAVDPAFNPYLDDDLLNVRVMDEDNREVPFLLQEQARVLHTRRFREYRIIAKTQEHKKSSLTLLNTDSLPINNITLWVRNADVTKTTTLLGSDDGKKWFALKHNFIVGPFQNPSGVTEIQIIDFPLSNYQYYRFVFEDSASAPVNISKAGFYEASMENIYPAIIPSRVIEKDTTEKRSCVIIQFDSARIVDELSIQMGSAPYFLRNASLFRADYVVDKKGKKEKRYSLLDEFNISSRQASRLRLSGQKVSELSVLIRNDDNPPLRVKNISAYQLHRYYVAWLQAGKQYTMKVGDAGIKQPSYDLKFFQDSIPRSPSLVTPGKLMIYQEPSAIATSRNFFTRQAVVWFALLAVAAMLFVMSLRLLKDMRK